ncbi:MAG: YbaN family protein, partial [Planctomycetaceae bacterium]|nr:YbaN family protein [Planctomycetaceae bacterium]
FFVLGALGLLLPGLPTTPFLLLTSYFLVRISPQLNQKLLRSRFVGGILTDWQVKRGVRSSVKVRAVSVVVLAVSATVYFTRDRPLPACVTVLLAAVGITVILRLPGIDELPVAHADPDAEEPVGSGPADAAQLSRQPANADEASDAST